MVGAVLSDFVRISAVALGLGALLAASEFWFSVVKWVGVGYLAYRGLRLLRSNGTLSVPPTLAVTFASIDFGVMFAYAVAGAQAIRALRAMGVLWLDRLCGGALLALAGSLALYRRNA
jgi:threonine/homoserine/homoserine lactone efflux protein